MQKLITDAQREMLANGRANAERIAKDGNTIDHKPVVKLFTPWGGCTWLLSELDPDNPDIAFGLCDLGMGCPELGNVSLSEIASVSGPGGLAIERDARFTATHTLTRYAARHAATRGSWCEAATDDAKAQWRVWQELPERRRTRDTILAALTEDKVSSHDRRAAFIGVDAYRAAGGSVTRDLFDPEDDGFFDNPELLNRLARKTPAQGRQGHGRRLEVGVGRRGVRPRGSHADAAGAPLADRLGSGRA